MTSRQSLAHILAVADITGYCLDPPALPPVFQREGQAAAAAQDNHFRDTFNQKAFRNRAAEKSRPSCNGDMGLTNIEGFIHVIQNEERLPVTINFHGDAFLNFIA